MGKDTFELAGREWPRVTWWKMRGMRTVYVTIWAAVITSATNGYDGSLINAAHSMPAWQKTFGYPENHSNINGMLTSIMWIGGILAVPIVPYIADTWGRRVGIVIGCTIMLGGVALVSIGFEVALFAVGRLVLGFGLGIAQSCSPLLLSEVVHPQHRPTYSTIYNSLWYVGSLIGACISLGSDHMTGNWSWRLPSLLQAIPSALQLIFIWLVPESPRWLISKGRYDQAIKVLAHVHAEGDEESEFIKFEFDEIKQTIAMEKELESDSWLDLVRGRGNIHRFIILTSIGFFSQWSGNGLISYYLNKILPLIGITDDIEQLRLNMYLQVVNVISATGICFFVEKIGRKPLFRVSITSMLAWYVGMTISSARYQVDLDNGTKNHMASNAFIVCVFFYYISYNLAFSGMLVSYTCEILPYRLRAKGLTAMFLAVDLALFFNSYTNPVALDAIGWKYYIVYCCWLGFEVVIVFWFYIETKGLPLEEIAKLFDGDSAAVGGGAASAKAAVLSGMDDGDEKHHETVEQRSV